MVSVGDRSLTVLFGMANLFFFVSIVFPSERVKMLLKWIIYHGEGIDGSQSL